MLGLLPLYLLRFGGIAPNSWQAFSVPQNIQKKTIEIIKNKPKAKRIKCKLKQVKLDENLCILWPTF